MNASSPMPGRPLLVDICICTFRRETLADALLSIARLRVPEGVSLRVIVADNDEVPSARSRVTALADGFPHELVYVHAPARNISVARNACLEAAKGDFLAFVDDDETVTEGWFAYLLETALAIGAGAALSTAVFTVRRDRTRELEARRSKALQACRAWVTDARMALTGYADEVYKELEFQLSPSATIEALISGVLC
jgi:glycosyltransferase involved in cell wall biosynthesis